MITQLDAINRAIEILSSGRYFPHEDDVKCRAKLEQLKKFVAKRRKRNDPKMHYTNKPAWLKKQKLCTQKNFGLSEEEQNNE